MQDQDQQTHKKYLVIDAQSIYGSGVDHTSVNTKTKNIITHAQQQGLTVILSYSEKSAPAIQSHVKRIEAETQVDYTLNRYGVTFGQKDIKRLEQKIGLVPQNTLVVVDDHHSDRALQDNGYSVCKKSLPYGQALVRMRQTGEKATQTRNNYAVIRTAIQDFAHS